MGNSANQWCQPSQLLTNLLDSLCMLLSPQKSLDLYAKSAIIHGVKLKASCYIHLNAFGLLRAVRPMPGPNAPGSDVVFARAPEYRDNKTIPNWS